MEHGNLNIPIESEFKEDPNFYVIFSTHGLDMGRMITTSKSQYCKEHQGELVIFNANIITEKCGKVWYGDVCVEEDFSKLKNVADYIGEDLYILMEGDARFGYEKRSTKVLMKLAKVVIKCNPKNKKNGKNKNKNK